MACAQVAVAEPSEFLRLETRENPRHQALGGAHGPAFPLSPPQVHAGLRSRFERVEVGRPREVRPCGVAIGLAGCAEVDRIADASGQYGQPREACDLPKGVGRQKASQRFLQTGHCGSERAGVRVDGAVKDCGEYPLVVGDIGRGLNWLANFIAD